MNDIERDHLWRNVEASVLPYNPAWSGEKFENKRYVEFLIELRDRGQMLHQKIIVFEDDLEVPGAYSWILNKMVGQIDQALVDRGHRNPVP